MVKWIMNVGGKTMITIGRTTHVHTVRNLNSFYLPLSPQIMHISLLFKALYYTDVFFCQDNLFPRKVRL